MLARASKKSKRPFQHSAIAPTKTKEQWTFYLRSSFAARKPLPLKMKSTEVFPPSIFPRGHPCMGCKKTIQFQQSHELPMKETHWGVEVFTDSQTGMLPGIPRSAMCVQRFDDSLNSAIHITYRNSLRSSSLREPRDPLPKVVLNFSHKGEEKFQTE